MKNQERTEKVDDPILELAAENPVERQEKERVIEREVFIKAATMKRKIPESIKNLKAIPWES